MLLPHFAYPAQAPSDPPIGAIITVRNKVKFTNNTRRNEEDIDEENEDAGGEDDSE